VLREQFFRDGIKVLVDPAKHTDFDIQRKFCGRSSPFLLENESGYQHWKKTKLECYSRFDPNRVITIEDHASLSPEKTDQLAIQLQTCNFAFFETASTESGFSTNDFLNLGRQFGLHRIDANLGAGSDGVSQLSVVDPADKRSRYIPYTTRALNWHTDGYYNSMSSRIDAFMLYCVNQAGRGGDNFVLDHEMVYMQIRDTDIESRAGFFV
jgi:hypothetical protein